MDRRAEFLLAVAATSLRGGTGPSLKDRFRDVVTKDPIESMLVALLVGSHLFYKAEKDVNPKVQTMADALVFVSTSMSVGYSDIFPKTEGGKLIATALQTFGPAMSAQALEKPHIASHTHEDETLETQRQIVSKLDAILAELKASRSS